jgi:hypothetical protein
MLFNSAGIRRRLDAARRWVRAMVIGWFIVFSLLGPQATTGALGGRVAANPSSNRGSPTEEEEHASRCETAPTKTAVGAFRRRAPSRPICHASRSFLPHFGPWLPSLSYGACVPPLSEHAMRNGIGTPLRC